MKKIIPWIVIGIVVVLVGVAAYNFWPTISSKFGGSEPGTEGEVQFRVEDVPTEGQPVEAGGQEDQAGANPTPPPREELPKPPPNGFFREVPTYFYKLGDQDWYVSCEPVGAEWMWYILPIDGQMKILDYRKATAAEAYAYCNQSGAARG